MPTNLSRKYNELLELDSYSETQRIVSLERIFIRDFISSQPSFRLRSVIPTPKDGKTTMDVLFDHLTKTREKTGERHAEYDRERSVRLHWVRHHIEERTPRKLDVFSVADVGAIRTYLYDRDEAYVVILEPKGETYFLITAYYLHGGNKKKIEQKFKRKLEELY